MKKRDKSRFPQTSDGTRVYNRQEQNAGWARKWVDENEK